MASIRCAHCKDTHTSVSEVRACATSYVPALALDTQARGAVYPGHEPWSAMYPRYVDTELAQAVADATDTAPDTAPTWEEIHAAYNRPEQTSPAPAPQPTASAWTWGEVNILRSQIRYHLHREERKRKIGYFALLAADGGTDRVKFYRVRTGSTGSKWAQHLFVDAQASGDFYPVRAKETVAAVLEGILADPGAASLLYATELGRCCRCARLLTDETSRARGIGPECYKKG